MTLAELMDSLRGSADVLGKVRYGIPTAEKERIALEGLLPGAPQANTAEAPEAQRYASGYLFAQQHPDVAEAIQPIVDRVRLAWFGDTPELQSYARHGANMAKMTAGLPLAALMAGRGR